MIDLNVLKMLIKRLDPQAMVVVLLVDAMLLAALHKKCHSDLKNIQVITISLKCNIQQINLCIFTFD